MGGIEKKQEKWGGTQEKERRDRKVIFKKQDREREDKF